MVDARKQSFGRKEALELAQQVDEIFSTKGSKVVHYDLKTEKPNGDELASALLGPTGNLRAPAIRLGRKLLVGFNPDTYERFFG